MVQGQGRKYLKVLVLATNSWILRELFDLVLLKLSAQVRYCLGDIDKLVADLVEHYELEIGSSRFIFHSYHLHIWSSPTNRALCRIKLLPVTCIALPVTCFGGHVDVNC